MHIRSGSYVLFVSENSYVTFREVYANFCCRTVAMDEMDDRGILVFYMWRNKTFKFYLFIHQLHNWIWIFNIGPISLITVNFFKLPDFLTLQSCCIYVQYLSIRLRLRQITTCKLTICCKIHQDNIKLQGGYDAVMFPGWYLKFRFRFTVIKNADFSQIVTFYFIFPTKNKVAVVSRLNCTRTKGVSWSKQLYGKNRSWILTTTFLNNFSVFSLCPCDCFTAILTDINWHWVNFGCSPNCNNKYENKKHCIHNPRRSITPISSSTEPLIISRMYAESIWMSSRQWKKYLLRLLHWLNCRVRLVTAVPSRI